MCCSVNGSVCVVCCVFDGFCELFVNQFALCLGVVVILLLHVMELFWDAGGALLDIPCMVFQSEVISSFKSLRAGSHAFALLMLFLYGIVIR